jgi:hypothetical protein
VQLVAARGSDRVGRYAGDHFGLPLSCLVVCGIGFGWPEAAVRVNSFRASRDPVDEVVWWTDDNQDERRSD